MSWKKKLSKSAPSDPPKRYRLSNNIVVYEPQMRELIRLGYYKFEDFKEEPYKTGMAQYVEHLAEKNGDEIRAEIEKVLFQEE